MLSADQVAIVTGASSGIGRVIAQRLASDGFTVIAHFNKNREGGFETCRLIEAAGGRAFPVGFDITNPNAAEQSLEDAMALVPSAKLGVLVNNAGLHIDGLLGLMSDASFDRVMKTNSYGPFYLMRWATRKMIRNRAGCIVNISSLAGQTGNPGQFNYAASKAALIAMTKSLAMEVGARGIRVNAVAPGLIETEMIQEIPMLQEMIKRIPLGRVGRPEEVAGVVSFLCSKDAGYITGHTLSVNGGLFPS
jgi:3-oxoacyl-[acyl-carrier protein] reductase